MFIDVTRHGGDRALRLAIAAIAYLDDAPDGCAIRLIGGESLRVAQGKDQIERRVDAAIGLTGGEATKIDPAIESAAIGAAERVGLISAEAAVDRRVDLVKAKGRWK